MIDREHRLSVSRQAKLLGISRGSVYDQRRPSSPADLALMRRMDALHLEYPFAGSRMLRGSMLRQKRKALSAPDHVTPDPRPPDLSLSVKEAGRCQTEPSLGDGHYLCAHGAWVRVSGGGYQGGSWKMALTLVLAVDQPRRSRQPDRCAVIR